MAFELMYRGSRSLVRTVAGGLLVPALLSFFVLGPALGNDAEARPLYSGIVVDANSGAVLYSSNPDGRRYPASLTKMMTLYVLFEEMKAGRMSKSSRMGVSAHAAAQAPSKLGLKPGQSIAVDDAIKALVTKSANDVAVVVAEAIGKTESAFARRMTKTARRIGMSRSTFRNASGLPDSGQVTTARDMATLGLRLQRDFPHYYRYFGIRSFSYNGRRYRTHNKLLGRFQGTDGIKTGYTRSSGFNLTASVKRGAKHIVGVVMGGRTGRSRDAQMRKILTAALRKASTRRPQPAIPIAEVPIPVPNPARAGTLTAEDRAVPETETPPVKPTVIASESEPTMASLVAAAQKEEPEAAKKETVEEETAEKDVASEDENGDETIVAEGDANAGDGTWSIQIGAFANKDDARRRLQAAQETGVAPLKGKKPLMIAFNKQDRVIYRARFAGFDRKTARRACSALNRKSINCYTLAP